MTPAKPVVVGGFVVGALVLGVIAILVFGGAHLFARNLRVVVVFKDSIAGLEVGAPVTFRGVRIGRVEGMRLHLDERRHTSWIPVYLDVYLNRISWTNGSVGTTRVDLQAAVDSGLRAQLVAQSLVSGQMSVNLDYRPDVPGQQGVYPEDAFEIPTIPSDIQNLKDELLHVDLPGIALKTQQVLAGMQKTLEEIDATIGPLAANLQSTLGATTVAVRSLQEDSARTLANIDRLANESRIQVATNGKELEQLLRTAERTANQADALVVSLNDMTSPHGDLQAALRDLDASAGSLRMLTHDLERNPVGTLLRREPQ